MFEEYSCGLDEKSRKFAEIYLNESEETARESIKILTQWLNDEAKDLNARKEAKYLLPFLRGCKFDVEKTKIKLTNYYKMKRDEVAWFSNRDPTLPELQELVNMGVFVPLKKLYENKLVVVVKTARHDPRVHKQDDVFKIGKMILDIAALESEKCQIYGVIAILDMKDVNYRHGMAMTPKVIKRVVHAWENYHCKPKQLEFINAPVYINVILDIFKSFMSKKLRERVRVHYGDGGKELQKIFDKEFLPVEYGGSGESMTELIDYWNKKLIEYKQWFKDDELYKAK